MRKNIVSLLKQLDMSLTKLVGIFTEWFVHHYFPIVTILVALIVYLYLRNMVKKWIKLNAYFSENPDNSVSQMIKYIETSSDIRTYFFLLKRYNDKQMLVVIDKFAASLIAKFEKDQDFYLTNDQMQRIDFAFKSLKMQQSDSALAVRFKTQLLAKLGQFIGSYSYNQAAEKISTAYKNEIGSNGKERLKTARSVLLRINEMIANQNSPSLETLALVATNEYNKIVKFEFFEAYRKEMESTVNRKQIECSMSSLKDLLNHQMFEGGQEWNALSDYIKKREEDFYQNEGVILDENPIFVSLKRESVAL